MTSRLSYASSPESDLELATDSRPSGLQDLGLPGSDRHMVKASSDPSIATQEEMSGPPGYNQLPGYSTARSRQVRITSVFLNLPDVYAFEISATSHLTIITARAATIYSE